MRQVQFQTVCSLSAAELDLHRAYSRSLGLSPPAVVAKKLAIVGGGDSAVDLEHWDGEVWGINGAATSCIRRGIPAVLVSVSPSDIPAHYFTGIKRAILADTCRPSVFDALKAADVAIFDHDDNGPTSTVAAAMFAATIGYREIHFFGCEGSYGYTTHCYQNTPIASDMLVKANGTEFRTNVGYLLQSQLLAHMVRNAGAVFKDCSGGLLSALIADPESLDVLKTPDEMKDAA